ncbi:helix-turn-helix domain-containing protein [Brucella sp. IR073]|uniref:helix-turn-helix domain-containing protein n=1 Tax=unclassified Brucella TaxID=2632610 RepID=UPI003B97FD47
MMSAYERRALVCSELRRAEFATADDLARRLNISVRTVYRHIASLRSVGHRIAGEAGVGYQYRGDPVCHMEGRHDR